MYTAHAWEIIHSFRVTKESNHHDTECPNLNVLLCHPLQQC